MNMISNFMIYCTCVDDILCHCGTYFYFVTEFSVNIFSKGISEIEYKTES